MRDDCDVLIAGGGPAGSIAALAAARGGSRVCLIERYNCLGGMMTSGMLAFLGPFDNARRAPDDWTRFRLDRARKPYPPELHNGIRTIRGLPEEILDELVLRDGADLHTYGYIPVNPEIVKRVLDDKVEAEGIDLRFHALAVGAKNLPDGRIEVTVAGKEGLRTLRARRVVDCTGDGDIAAGLHCEFDKGRSSDGRVQGVTLVFWLGGVHLHACDLLPDRLSGLREQARNAFQRGEFTIDPLGGGCQNPVPGWRETRCRCPGCTTGTRSRTAACCPRGRITC